MRLLIKGGRVIDPARDMDEVVDILVDGGKIFRLEKNIPEDGEGLQVIAAKNKLVVPGLIDMHTHLREPGFEYKETVLTGGMAAAAGGFTSIACMPNTDPVNDNRSVTEFILRQALAGDLVHIYPVAAITKGSEGLLLSEFGDLKEAGAIAFSDDGRPVVNSMVMRSALEYAASFDMPVISHCEDPNLCAGGLMNEGQVSTELGLKGIPNTCEEVMVARDITLAEFTGTAVHIAHVSAAGSVRLIREAKKRNVKVTAETAPQYFTLTDEALRGFDTNLKMNPPLRTASDVEAIKEGLRDGTIDVIASDHAPQSTVEKDVEFEYAANGIIGLETSLPLSLRLVDEDVLSVKGLIEKMSVNPAKVLKLQKGSLTAGMDADITIIDPGTKWKADAGRFRSKSRNSPFHGWPLKGRAVCTIVDGKIKYQEL